MASWADLSALFKKAKEHHGRIDYVFANAGIGPRANYLVLETDENGDLKEPSQEVLDINLKSVINTACLAVHYMKQQPEGGSIVLMSSSTSLQPLRAPDYCKSRAKHCLVDTSEYFKLTEACSHGQTRCPRVRKRSCTADRDCGASNSRQHSRAMLDIDPGPPKLGRDHEGNLAPVAAHFGGCARCCLSDGRYIQKWRGGLCL